MRTVAIIGKNFGDEGKGLACASLSHNIKNTLIIKHNGGGQAGQASDIALWETKKARLSQSVKSWFPMRAHV